MNCYYDEAAVEMADMELCLPVKKKMEDITWIKKSCIKGQKVSFKTLPKVKAVCTIHYGSKTDYKIEGFLILRT